MFRSREEYVRRVQREDGREFVLKKGLQERGSHRCRRANIPFRKGIDVQKGFTKRREGRVCALKKGSKGRGALLWEEYILVTRRDSVRRGPTKKRRGLKKKEHREGGRRRKTLQREGMGRKEGR